MVKLGTILCPFCFNKIPVTKIEYLCMAAGCDEYNKPIVNTKPDKNGVCICSACKHTTTRRRCPECASLLPQDILQSKTRIISIVGGAGSGKSYFVGSLLEQIMENHLLNRYNNISTIWGKGSDVEYKMRFAKYFRGGKILPATVKRSDLIKDNPPLLLELGQRKKSILGLVTDTDTFSFFDAAGESFENEDDLAAITPYLKHSEAVILILDPRQVPYLDKKISAQFPNLSRPTDSTYVSILSNTKELLKREIGVSGKRRIKIPLCVCFSKWDLLLKTPDLLPEGLTVGITGQNVDYFDENIVNTISSEIRSLLMQWDHDLVNFAENNFTTVKYFAFSAWGTADKGGNEAPPIAPFRVEDPLLWILHRKKII